MKEERTVRYERPELTAYRFLGVANGDEWEGGWSGGGDIGEECDPSGFDDEA